MPHNGPDPSGVSHLKSDALTARLTVAFGAGALALTVMLALMEPLLAGRCARAFSAFVFQLGGFEAADDLLMGLCGLERSLAMRWINRLDIILLIPTYTAFLILAARVMGGRWTGWRVWTAIGFALAAAGADFVETTTQLAVSDWASLNHGRDFEAMREAMDNVLMAARLKYAFFAGNAAVMALTAFLKQPRPLRFIGAACLAPVMGVSAVVDDPERAPLAAITFAIGWGALIFYARRVSRLAGATTLAPAPDGQP